MHARSSPPWPSASRPPSSVGSPSRDFNFAPSSSKLNLSLKSTFLFASASHPHNDMADEHTGEESLGPHGDRAVAKGGSLADLILDAPERFANGDQQIAQESLGAVKAIFDYGEEFNKRERCSKPIAHRSSSLFPFCHQRSSLKQWQCPQWANISLQS